MNINNVKNINTEIININYDGEITLNINKHKPSMFYKCNILNIDESKPFVQIQFFITIFEKIVYYILQYKFQKIILDNRIEYYYVLDGCENKFKSIMEGVII